MKKISKKVRSGILNSLLIIGTIALVFFLGARNGDLPAAWQALLHAERSWIALAFLSCVIFILFETLVLYVFYRFQRVPVRFSTSLLATLIGMFYSSVTPAATGGQPMQVVVMNKRNVPGGVTSSGLAVKFFCFQTSLLLMAAVLWLLFRDFVSLRLGPARWFIYAGFFLNGSAILLVLLLSINAGWVQKILNGILSLLCKARIIRREQVWREKMDRALGDFSASVQLITGHPFQLLVLLLVSCVQVLGLMSVIYCVYRALGLNTLDYAHILTLQLLLYIGAAFTPLPGSSGAQEGGFYILFSTVFPDGALLGALLLWRFFTYYFPMLAGLAGVITDSVSTLRGKVPRVPRADDTPSPLP